MAARVVHHSTTVIEGVKSEIVGCQFVARIEPATGTSPATVVKYDFTAARLPNPAPLDAPALRRVCPAEVGGAAARIGSLAIDPVCHIARMKRVHACHRVGIACALTRRLRDVDIRRAGCWRRDEFCR